jgi:sn-2 palmitoyl-lipid 9-desaturase
MTRQIELTKHLISGLFVTYFLLLPVWIYYATWYQLAIGYVCYWFMIDVIQSLFMHRWAAHNFWNPPGWLQKVLSLIAVVGLLGTPITYSAWHRTHHAFSDTEKDPHAPVYKGWLYVIFAQYHSSQIRRAVDRLRDPYFAFLTKHMIYFVLFGNLALFALLPFTWFMTLWAIPVGCTIFNTNFFLGVVAHKSGDAKDFSLWAWPFLFDDGISHGSHHRSPAMSQISFDPAGWVVKKLGWAHGSH